MYCASQHQYSSGIATYCSQQAPKGISLSIMVQNITSLMSRYGASLGFLVGGPLSILYTITSSLASYVATHVHIHVYVQCHMQSGGQPVQCAAYAEHDIIIYAENVHTTVVAHILACMRKCMQSYVLYFAEVASFKCC